MMTPRISWIIGLALCASICTSDTKAQVFFSEDFESLPLGPPVDETFPDDMPYEAAFSPTGPDGWSIDRTNTPEGGVTEFRGWNFVDPIWWNQVAGQDRANFATGEQGFVIAVADGDEWDDAPHAEGIMQTMLTTPSIPVVGGATTDLSFDNSWRPEAPQTARLTASFDGGAPVEVFFWESDSASENFREESPGLNERLEVPIDAPAGVSDVSFSFEYTGGNNWWWAIDNIEFGAYEETFEDVVMQENVMEGRASNLPFDPESVWTPDAPDGWTIDSEETWGIDEEGIGVTEWKGWTFANKDFWTTVAGDQNRSFFTKGEGTVAIADPDEWDDLGSPGNIDAGQIFESFLTTPEIAISDADAESLTLTFDSSWRPEDTQAANLTVSFDGGPAVEVLSWSSDEGSDEFKPDSENETVTIELANPDGASTMQLTWGMLESSNDWWWAIDNIVVSSGGVAGLPGDFNADGILDAGDIDELTRQASSGGNDVAFDLNNDGMVNSSDISVWAGDLRNTYIGDANLDGEFNSSDLVVLFGAGTYEADVDAAWSQGDFNGDGRFSSGDLVAALTDGGYEQGPRAAVAAAVPEPSTLTLVLLGLLAFARRRF